jgi:hypothetical protein
MSFLESISVGDIAFSWNSFDMNPFHPSPSAQIANIPLAPIGVGTASDQAFGVVHVVFLLMRMCHFIGLRCGTGHSLSIWTFSPIG